MMILDKENNKEPEYINWDDCPKYRTIKLSQLIDQTDTLIKSKMYLRVTLTFLLVTKKLVLLKKLSLINTTVEKLLLFHKNN